MVEAMIMLAKMLVRSNLEPARRFSANLGADNACGLIGGPSSGKQACS